MVVHAFIPSTQEAEAGGWISDELEASLVYIMGFWIEQPELVRSVSRERKIKARVVVYPDLMSKEEKRTRDIMPSDPTDPNEADPQSDGGQEADNVDRSKVLDDLGATDVPDMQSDIQC